MSAVNNYSCKVFLKNIRIQQEIVIDNDTQILQSCDGYTCYDSANYMVDYLKSVTDDKANFNIEKLSKDYSRQMPVCVIKLWNVKALNLEEAAQVAVKKSQPIINFLTYNQGQSPDTFGVTASRKDEGTYLAVLPVTYCGYKVHLMDNLNTMARYTTDRIQHDGKLNLYLTLFSDAMSESNVDFRIVRLWTILETMAVAYQVRGKEQKVRALVRDYEINVKQYGDYDLLKLAYMHRNAIVHEGSSDPQVVSPDYISFLTVSTKNVSNIISELQELVSFIIRLYMRRTA